MGFRDKASYLLQRSSDAQGDKLKVGEDSSPGAAEKLEDSLNQANTKENTNFLDGDKKLSNKNEVIQGEAMADKAADNHINKLSQLIYFIEVLDKNLVDEFPVDYGELSDIMSQLLGKLSELFDIKMASVLVEDTNNSFNSLATIGFTGNEDKRFTLSKSNKLLGKFFDRGEATFIDEYQSNDEIVNELSGDVDSVKFFLLLPMIVQGHSFGALNILSLKDLSIKELSNKDVEVFSIISFLLSSFLYRLIGYLPDIGEQKEEADINNESDVFMSTLDFMEKKMAYFDSANIPVSVFIVTFTNTKQYLVEHKSYEYNKLVHRFIDECLTILDNPGNFHRFAINKFILVFEGIYDNMIKEKKTKILDGLKNTFGNTFIPGCEPYHIINTSFNQHNHDPYSLINYFNI
jgi:hypothetical protein